MTRAELLDGWKIVGTHGSPFFYLSTLHFLPSPLSILFPGGLPQPAGERALVDADFLGELERTEALWASHPLDHARSESVGVIHHGVFLLRPRKPS